MKKIICTLLVLTVMLSSAVFASDIYYSESDIQNLMSQLDIMNGYEDGSFHPERNVTRAEFAKMAVNASQYHNMVAPTATSSPFKDVSYQHWAAPYIKVASVNKIINGYPDSTYQPDKNVSYEEAVTVAINLLGYTSADFTASWPYGHLGTAQQIGLTDNVDGHVGEALTRGQVRTLLFNMLMTEARTSNAGSTRTTYESTNGASTTTTVSTVSASSASGRKYITNLDYTLVEDAVIIATSAENTAVAAGKVLTSAGTYKTSSSFDASYVGKRGDILLNSNNEFVFFFPTEQMINAYNLYSVLDNDLLVYSGSGIESLGLDSGTAVYYDASRTTLSAVSGRLEMGSEVRLYKDSMGNIEYVFVSKDSVSEPFTNNGNWKSVLGVAEDPTVIRDGKAATSADISINDVVYYSSSLNIVWAYSKKVTGIYEASSPNRETPSSVTISGTTYSIETAEAMHKLSAGSSYTLGDTVTILIGKSGGIADVLDASKSSLGTLYGYVLSTGNKAFSDTESNTVTSPYAEIALPDGSANIYKTKSNYSNLVNRIVSIKIADGVASLNAVSQTSSISGKFNTSTMTLGGKAVSSDVEIIDVSTTLASEKGVFKHIYPQRLNGVTVNSSDILYCGQNALGEITQLILKNVTGDCFDYGLITAHPKDSTQFTVLNATNFLNFNISNYSLTAGQPVRINSPNSLTKLSLAKGTFTEMADSYIEIGSTKYMLSDSVIVYDCTKSLSGIYNVIPLSDIVGLSRSDVTLEAYYDAVPSEGGRIRVIKATFKN